MLVKAECQQEADAAHPAPVRGRWKRNAAVVIVIVVIVVVIVVVAAVFVFLPTHAQRQVQFKASSRPRKKGNSQATTALIAPALEAPLLIPFHAMIALQISQLDQEAMESSGRLRLMEARRSFKFSIFSSALRRSAHPLRRGHQFWHEC